MKLRLLEFVAKKGGGRGVHLRTKSGRNRKIQCSLSVEESSRSVEICIIEAIFKIHLAFLPHVLFSYLHC